MKNIILIGMPASGKSTIGVVLAKTLGIGFVDTDLIIQQRENRLLQEIIDQDGLEFFLDCEKNAVLESDFSNSVIATGGSVVFREESMKKLKQNGTIIFLDVPLETVKKRLYNIKTRGVAAEKSKTIEEIYEERLALYQKYADITISSGMCSVEENVSKIIKTF